MSFEVRQKVGKYVYIYDVESYWDKEKKQSRQIRKYIGREDKLTGKIVDTKHPDKSVPTKALDFGAVFLINNLLDQLGISEICQKVFPEDYKQILELIKFTVVENESFYLAEKWAEKTKTEIPAALIASQRISEIFYRIGIDENKRTEFFKEWIKKHQEEIAIYYDISSVSSYSKHINLVEWGYNRDGESLPQINFGVVYGAKLELPLYYQIYPGSIPDVSTFMNIKKYNEAYGIKDTVYIVDRGFYSKTNLEALKNEKIIIPLSLSTNITLELLIKFNSELSKSKNLILSNEDLYSSVTTEVEIHKIKYTAYIFRNKTAQEKSETIFFKTLLQIENKISKNNYLSENEIIKAINELSQGFSKYFIFKKIGITIKLKRNDKNIKEFRAKCGAFILISSDSKYKKEEILDLYKCKDKIEKVFDCLKNDIDKDRLRVHSSERVNGMMLIAFISLIITSHIEKILREKKLNKQYSKNELFSELDKVRIIQYTNGINIITEPNKKIKDIFTAFNIDFSSLLA